MKVKVIWEFEADVEDIDDSLVDIYGLAIDSARREVEYMLDANLMTYEDFDYQVEEPPVDPYGEPVTQHYNPVERAYRSLVNVFHTKKKPLKANMELAIEEAIGYLGEALK